MEEDIKIIEECKIMDDTILHSEHSKRLRKAIENLLKRYKELEEENERYKVSLLQESKPFILGCIPISVIQNKIDEVRPIVDSYEKQMENDEETDLSYEEVRNYACKIDVLQELLEERNN